MLKGNKIILRPVESQDIEKFYKWRNDPDIKKMAMMHPFPVTLESEKKWFENISNNKDNKLIIFSVVDNSDKRVVGFIRLFNINWIHRYSYFGIVLGEEIARGKGFGKDAVKLIVDYALNTLNLHKIVLEVIDANNIAIELYKQLGFIEEGRLKNQVLIDNHWHDVLIMSLLKDKEE